MFILRTIASNIPSNTVIGERYCYVGRHENYEEFCGFFLAYYGRPHVADLDPSSDDWSKKCYAFITTGAQTIPLYINQSNYVMTSEGQTFENVTQR